MDRFKKIYVDSVLILFNTVLIFVALNLLLGAVYFVYDTYVERRGSKQDVLFNQDGSPVDNGKRSNYQFGWFDYNATREVNPALAAEMLDDFYALGRRGFIYQPWVQFSEPPFAGKHLSVDIDERGIPLRRTLNPPTDKSKPVINVFILGGSTTFGYHVADEHTWPSYLSAILNEKAKSRGLNLQVSVMNYGRGYYDTSQEMALIIDLLKSGHRPSLILFMDGVNLGGKEDIPPFTGLVENAMADVQHGNEKVVRLGLKEWVKRWIPAVRLLLSLKSRWQKSPPASNQPVDSELTPTQQEYISHVLKRFEQNRRIIKDVCRQYGAETMFFIQPDAVYNYPADLYRRVLPSTFLASREERKLFHEQIRHSPEIFYLGQLFDDYGVGQGRKAIVDDVHYSPDFNRLLAERVASYIDPGKLAGHSTDYPSAPTGAIRQVFHSEWAIP